MSETKEEPFVVNQKNLKNDMIHFKDDVLKDMKSLEREMTEKFDMTNNLMKEKFDSYDRKFNLYNEKIAQISNLLVTDKDLNDKIEKLVQGKLDLRDHILTNEVKFTNLEKEFHEKIEKIEYVLNDSVIYPSVIGPKGKYKTFHEFIDYVLQQLAQTAIFRDKNSFDLSSYKNKLENLIQSFKFQLDNIIKSTNQFTTKSVNECEERVKGMLMLYDDRLTDVRVENQNYIKDLEAFYRDLKDDIKKLNAMKNGIYNRFSNEVFNMKRDNVQVVKIFGNYKKEFKEMKDTLSKLAEFIKDIRFRINIGQEIKRREFINMANRIDYSKKPNKDDNISSGVRKYINGEINADELAQTRRFTKTNINLQNINNTVNNKNVNNNNFNMDEDFEDSMNSINNYLAKNNYFDPDYNNNNFSNPQMQGQPYVSPEYLNAYRRKSVNNLISGMSLKNFKNNAQLLNQNQNLRNNLNTSNNSFKSQNNNINFSKSLDKGRKRYQSVVSGNFNSYDNYMNLQNFEMRNNKNKANSNTIKSSSMDSEDLKNSKEGVNYNNNNNNFPKNVIREEDEIASKVSENESVNKSGLEEEKIKSNRASKKIDNQDNAKVPNNDHTNMNTNIKMNMNQNQNNMAVIKPPQNNETENTLNKPILGHSGNISLSTMKSLSKPKETQKSDKKANNNIVIDCDSKNLNKNKDSNANISMEKNMVNNKSETSFDKSNINNISVIKKDITKNNTNDYLPNYNLLSISSYKNPLSNSENKTNKSNFNNSNARSIPKTTFSAKKEGKGNTLQPLNVDKNINTISVGTEYKSFKGKKYDTNNLSFIAKINESAIPYESQINTNNFRPKNSNKKLLPKMSDKYYNNNSHNLLLVKEDDRAKHYKNSSMNSNTSRNNEAKHIQRMVNDLQSYISNHTNIADDRNSINNMYKNGQNFIFKEMNNSYLGNNYNNQPSSNSNQKIRKNIFQLKLK